MKYLVTPRLLMRPYDVAELDDFYSLVSRKDVMQKMTIGRPFSLAEARQQFKGRLLEFERTGFGIFAIFERKEKRFIGECGVRETGKKGVMELSCLLLPDSWNKGYATEAMM